MSRINISITLLGLIAAASCATERDRDAEHAADRQGHESQELVLTDADAGVQDAPQPEDIAQRLRTFTRKPSAVTGCNYSAFGGIQQFVGQLQNVNFPAVQRFASQHCAERPTAAECATLEHNPYALASAAAAFCADSCGECQAAVEEGVAMIQMLQASSAGTPAAAGLGPMARVAAMKVKFSATLKALSDETSFLGMQLAEAEGIVEDLRMQQSYGSSVTDAQIEGAIGRVSAISAKLTAKQELHQEIDQAMMGMQLRAEQVTQMLTQIRSLLTDDQEAAIALEARIETSPARPAEEPAGSGSGQATPPPTCGPGEILVSRIATLTGLSCASPRFRSIDPNEKICWPITRPLPPALQCDDTFGPPLPRPNTTCDDMMVEADGQVSRLCVQPL